MYQTVGSKLQQKWKGFPTYQVCIKTQSTQKNSKYLGYSWYPRYPKYPKVFKIPKTSFLITTKGPKVPQSKPQLSKQHMVLWYFQNSIRSIFCLIFFNTPYLHYNLKHHGARCYITPTTCKNSLKNFVPHLAHCESITIVANKYVWPKLACTTPMN